MNKRLPCIMPSIQKHLKRVGVLKKLSRISDPRRTASCRWELDYVLEVVLSAMLSGCRTLREVESFSAGYDERIPDTTLHDILVQLDPAELYTVLRKDVKQSLRSHELPKDEFPIRVMVVDGKNLFVGASSNRGEDDTWGDEIGGWR